MSSDKKLVQVLEEDGWLKYIDETGFAHTYKGDTKQIYIDLLSVTAGEYFDLQRPVPDSNIEQLSNSGGMSGRGVIEDKVTISVIGDPDNIVRELEVSICNEKLVDGLSDSFRKLDLDKFRAQRGIDPSESLPLFSAKLAYSGPDLETRTEGVWYLSVYIPDGLYRKLRQAVLNSQIIGVSIGLTLYRAYTDDYYAVRTEGLFLRPSIEYGDAKHPEPFLGKVNGLSVNYAKFEASTTKEPDVHPETDTAVQDETHEVSAGKATIEALQQANLAIMATRSAIIGLRTAILWASIIIASSLIWAAYVR